MNRRKQKKLADKLVWAAMSHDVKQVRALLRSGADPDAPDVDGETPLYAASVQGAAENVRLLLAAGASPDAQSSGPGSDGTPLCAAACWGETAVVRELLAGGADPNLREDEGTGMTALEWAEAGPHPETADVLRAAAGA
ncbi:ankyrin repeat domain-containing protein [Streptomyces sp. NBC_01465]|uniref:ankyrin repeat domain-containing protein n=1 Tax=Streptomyces sp. NBC_01465 TaxID=2903878 RepID=UPI002E349C06|nr:ankyrin repeat domain-containing protein [Streptomyces sp. NBC_01465]